MEQNPTCPVCTQANHCDFFMRKDGYDLYRCSDCQHIFVWPIPTIDQLERVYSFANAYQVQAKTTYDENTPALDKTRESLRQIEIFCPNRERLLDVGCSAGSFLWLAKRNGWSSVRGVELNQDTAEIARHNGIEVFVGELAAANFPPGSFEAIHLGDVIEHVQDPGEFLARVSVLLQPDGVVVIVTPNHDALFPWLTYWLYRLFRVPWSHPTPPYRLNQFSEKSLAKLVEKADLRVVDKQYHGCALMYELGETHVLRSFREALAARRLRQAAGRLLLAAFTVSTYTIIYGIDRCCAWKRKDFEMRFVARKTSVLEQASAEKSAPRGQSQPVEAAR